MKRSRRIFHQAGGYVGQRVPVAHHWLSNVARMWAETSLDQKQRVPGAFFPSQSPTAGGISNPPNVFGVEVVGAIAAPKDGEVSLPILTWNQLLAWLREMDLLRQNKAA